MTTTTRRPTLRSVLVGAAALAVLGVTGACGTGAGSDSDSGSGGDSAGAVSADAPADQAPDASQADGALATEAPVAESVADTEQAGGSDGAGDEEKVISNGSVRLRSGDVAKTLFDVRGVVDTYAGEVEANETQTDDEGDPLRARLTLRIPTARFDDAMQDLEGVATLVASSGNTKNVTTEVLDRDIRVQVQRRSIERISLLLEQASSIRDVVAIEAQLSQRQADLAVLEKEQRYLADQTAMATVNVSIERTPTKGKPPAEKKDDDGFFAGLGAGWHGLKTFGVGLATVLGALLPWMIVAAVLAIPGVPLLRRYRRRGPVPTSAA